jgi:RNA polymerase sigma-70 factor (ECF subfamily)
LASEERRVTTDAELVRRTRDGDREAFGELADRYRDMVYGLGYHLTRDFEAARDLAQEAFVQAFTKLDQLREPGKFAGWLRRIAHSVHRDGLRRRELTTVALEEDAHAGRSRERASEAELAVRLALERLREPDRLALTLHYIDGYTHAEIGSFLGIEREAVKTRVARARKRLQGKVIEMVEDVFREHALPPEFSKDVVSAVNRMVGGLRAAVPVPLSELAANIHRLHKQAWRDIIPQLPSPYGPPLKEFGEAPQIPVSELPAEVQRAVRQAMCYTWLSGVLSTVLGTMPWVKDPESLWIRFYREDGELYAWFADVPGESGYISACLPTDAESARRQAAPYVKPEGAGPEALGCELPAELRDALESLRGSAPEDANSLQQALHMALGERLRQVWDDLPEGVKSAGATDRSIPVRDLPDRARQALGEAVACHWGGCVLRGLQSPDSWMTESESSTVEFGLYPREPRRDWSGQEYVKLSGPRWNSMLHTGIAEEFDEYMGG